MKHDPISIYAPPGKLNTLSKMADGDENVDSMETGLLSNISFNPSIYDVYFRTQMYYNTLKDTYEQISTPKVLYNGFFGILLYFPE